MEDIITAVATAFGEGGISIVRLSGIGCTKLAERILKGTCPLSSRQPRMMTLYTLHDNDDIFDEALIVRFVKNASYTGEESVEIHCHGGILAAQRCTEALCRLGARTAQPGEFTRRAFINGRMDLSQAESVLGIINAKSNEALTASTRTLQGKFTRAINQLLDDLTELSAQLEVNLDFPEEGEGLREKSVFTSLISKALNNGELIASQCRAGLLLREGIRTAIVGRPNVGKSSLLNALLGEERAIVTPIPGTTRDRIEETFIYKGVPIRIVDTAGIRRTNDNIESIGVNVSLKVINDADICVWVIDSSQPLNNEDIELGRLTRKHANIIVLNKSDLAQKTTTRQTILNEFPESKIICSSALRHCGIEQIKDAIIQTVSNGGHFSGSYGVTARQMNCINSAVDSLKEALNADSKQFGDDIVASCVSEARKHISSLLGLDASENLLDEVFSKFCVGK
jgi:tRNA modification GTPase